MIDDTKILDQIQEHGDVNRGWIARDSCQGRGFRLHQTSTPIGEHDWRFPAGFVVKKTVREALEQYFVDKQ